MMKKISLIIGLCAALVARAQTPQPPVAATVYVASTPCSSGTKPVPGIPKNAGCELIKWQLRLFPMGTYVLDCSYGMPKQGTRGFIGGGNKLHREGKWTVGKGTKTDASAVVYQLDPDKPSESIAFVRLGETLLHLLDNDRRLMIGTGAWSYTLSKVQL